jgi:hypothetical protein
MAESGWRVFFLDAGIAVLGSSLPVKAAGPTELTFAASGRSVALYEPETRELRVFTGMPETPRLAFSAEMSMLPGRVTALAVSDDGRRILAGVTAQEGGSVWMVTGSDTERIAAAGRPSAIRFAGLQDALIADDGWNQVTAVRNLGGQVRTEILGSAVNGIDKPRDVWFSPATGRIVVANTGAQNLLLLESGGSAQTITCDSPPKEFHPLPGGTAIAISSSEHGPLWILDTLAARPKLTSIPSVD